MKRLLAIVSMFAGVIGVLAFTHFMQAVSVPENLDCLEERMVEYGWTSETPALAKMAAIMRWQTALSETNPGFANWHQATDRYLDCNEINSSQQIQCSISALPCRYETASGTQ